MTRANGPYSAADNYSIFNGGREQGFFELETIAGAIVQDGSLKGSRLVSKTSFAVFAEKKGIIDFFDTYLA